MKMVSLILAAGLGTRMKSDVPKIMHEIAGLPLIEHLVCSLSAAGLDEKSLVLNKKLENFDFSFNYQGKYIQAEQLGTADAVRSAENMYDSLNDEDVVLVTFADTPLIQTDTFLDIKEKMSNDPNLKICLLGFYCHLDPEENHYGRLVQDEEGQLHSIKEFVDCSEAEKEIPLCNSGIMALRVDFIKKYLPLIQNNNKKSEYYLTDLVHFAYINQHKTDFVIVEESECLGVNTPFDLHILEQIFQERQREYFIGQGVKFTDADTVYFHHDTDIASGVRIEPHVIFGENVQVKENAVIKGFSHIEGAIIEGNASVGPFARLRPGAHIDQDAKVGNFVEVKKTHLGKGAKASHLTYLGDTEVGEGANIGAGTITCNYDGQNKYKTQIGKNVFVGSNTSLVAPVEIDENSLIAAGSVITRNVPKNSLAVARGKQENKENWFEKLEKRKQKIKNEG